MNVATRVETVPSGDVTETVPACRPASSPETIAVITRVSPGARLVSRATYAPSSGADMLTSLKPAMKAESSTTVTVSIHDGDSFRTLSRTASGCR